MTEGGRTFSPGSTDQAEESPRRRLRLVAVVALVVAAYYLVPVFEPAAETGTLLRAAATVALLGLAAWFVAREVMRGVHAGSATVRLDLAVSRRNDAVRRARQLGLV